VIGGNNHGSRENQDMPNIRQRKKLRKDEYVEVSPESYAERRRATHKGQTLRTDSVLSGARDEDRDVKEKLGRTMLSKNTLVGGWKLRTWITSASPENAVLFPSSQ
jgi:hypothetical protein